MCSVFERLQDENIDTSIQALNEFVSQNETVFAFPDLDQTAKRERVWSSIYKIATNSQESAVVKNCFIAIRILSREKTCLNELFTDAWYNLAVQHSGLTTSVYPDALLSIEVLKSLCNLIFNSRVVAAMCCKKDTGILPHITSQLKNISTRPIPDQIIFFSIKILFLLTALCSEIRGQVKEDLEAHKSMVELLQHILKELKEQSGNNIVLADDKVDLVCEILKALFNITLKIGLDDEQFCNQLVSLLRIYILLPTSTKEKKFILHNNIVNLLTNIPDSGYEYLIVPLEDKKDLPEKYCFEGNNMMAFYELLQCLQEKFDEEISVGKQRDVLSPIISVLLKAASSNRAIRKYLRAQILPPLTDVHNRPEHGTTLRNHLCRLLTSPMTQLRDMIANLLFVLCKMNVKRMIKYTGYGNSAGLFFQRGLLNGQSDAGAEDFSSNSEDSDTEEYTKHKHGINPVTGCFEAPHANPMANMSDEQKEYEAVKLVQLLDDLMKCGTIRPCRVGEDGKAEPIEHVLQLQQGLRSQRIGAGDTDDEEQSE